MQAGLVSFPGDKGLRNSGREPQDGERGGGRIEPVEQDHYSILGVTPKAEPAEIRTAYRALMRIYHPDADRSSEAADRARQINAAYSVLNNPERRASYDDSLAEHRRIRFEPVAAQAVLGPRRFSYGAAVAIFVAVLAAGMIAFAVSPSMTGLSATDTSTITDRPPPPLPTTAQREDKGKVAIPDLCSDNRAAGLIKQALFQRASGSGSADRALLAQAEPLASARVESAHSEDVGCAGWLSLDIPPGVAVDGDRINLSSEITFALIRTEDGAIQLSTLSGAENVVRALSTLEPELRAAGPLEAAKPQQLAALAPGREKVLDSTKVRQASSAPARPPKSPVDRGPCATTAHRSDRMICENGNLASLDRQLSNFYRQSWDRADEGKRGLLLGTRQQFNVRRDACASPDCLTTAYVARLREIGDIMAGRKSP
jgi:hypothetical protein